MNLLPLHFRPRLAGPEIRAEVLRLGERRHGWPMRGGLSELRELNPPAGRAVPPRACVANLYLEES